MADDVKQAVMQRLRAALAVIAPETASQAVEIALELPRDPAHGDLSTNLAMQLAKRLRRPPRDIAQALVTALMAPSSGAENTIAAAEVAGGGFLNLRIAPAAMLDAVARVLKDGKDFGRAPRQGAAPVQVEFVSANPTGPLHVGHGRQGALGDALAAILEASGHEVSREFYYNDAGAQIRNLALSVQARARGISPGDPGWPADGYQGEYIADIAADFLAGKSVAASDGPPFSATGKVDDLEAIRRFAVAYLRREQDEDLRAFGVRFDVYYLESSLYGEGRVDAVVEAFAKNRKSYEANGALWLRTTEYGDDKDRVVRKSDGGYTYFVPDVAYHLTKWQRGFRKVIDVQGTDHHSTITRVRAGLQAIGAGIPEGFPDYVLHSLVKVVRDGEEVKISKRAGSYVTLRDLIEWVGRDAVRFFLVSRRADSEFIFDVDLARSKSEENPVYYVQYAHARVCSVFAQAGGIDASRLASASLAPLCLPRELALARKLGEFPGVIGTAARELSPHLLAFYLRELAGEFHAYYNSERFLVDDESLRTARLALCAAVRIVLANGLALLGVSAPEKM